MNRWMLVLIILGAAFSLAGQNTVFPGDANANGRVDHHDILSIGYAFGKVGPSRLVVEGLDMPLPQVIAQAWSQTFPDGLNLIHADANGNGLVEFSDLVLVSENYGAQEDEVSPLDFPLGLPAVDAAFVLNDDQGVEPLEGGETVTFPIRLAGDLAQTPINGLAFSLFYHPGHFAGATFSFGDHALRQDGEAIEFIRQTPGRIDVVISRYGNDPVVLDDEPIGSMSLIIIDDLIGLMPTAPDTMPTPIVLDSVRLVDSNLVSRPVVTDSLTLKLYRSGTLSGLGEPRLDALRMLVFPNPTTGPLRLTTQAAFRQLELLWPDGRRQLLYLGPPRRQWQLLDWPEGFHFGWIRATGAEGASCHAIFHGDP